MELIRLQKYLSGSGICSRRQGEKYIKDGFVRINGEVVTTPGVKIDPDKDQVEFQGELVKPEPDLIYIALNKPKGYITTCKQPGRQTVMNLLDIENRVYPVGRLDKDSTGLLLMTNDGRIHHRLLHPSFDHEKEYEVTVAEPIQDSDLRKMAQGLTIMGEKTRSAEIKRISHRRFRIVLKEGKNRQIRRMVRKVGNQVAELRRIRIANIRIGRLAEGTWRFLTEKEKKELLKTL